MVKGPSIAHLISPDSYTNGTHAFLEENVDLGIFIQAIQATNLPYRVLPVAGPVEIATAGPSPVRSLDRFKPPEITVGVPLLVGSVVGADAPP